MLPVPCANAIGIIDRIRTSDDAGFSKDARRKLSSEPKPLTTDGKQNLLWIIAFPPNQLLKGISFMSVI
jgi:hypothetical protein